jgi:hypothetical protein
MVAERLGSMVAERLSRRTSPVSLTSGSEVADLYSLVEALDGATVRDCAEEGAVVVTGLERRGKVDD